MGPSVDSASLPSEVVAEIIGNLAREQNQLYTCCLVNRSWNFHAIALLWKVCGGALSNRAAVPQSNILECDETIQESSGSCQALVTGLCDETAG